jgi:hypothetical protein
VKYDLGPYIPEEGILQDRVGRIARWCYQENAGKHQLHETIYDGRKIKEEAKRGINKCMREEKKG